MNSELGGAMARLWRLLPIVGLLACGGQDPIDPGSVGASCTSTDQCDDDLFCDRPVDSCAAQGECKALPQACNAVYSPVCGCDGHSYGDSCGANLAGTSVAHEGPCACLGNDYCEPSEYCYVDFGCGAGEGTCEPRPQACDAVDDPVCGCDGVTYGNFCEAAAAGHNVDHAGGC